MEHNPAFVSAVGGDSGPSSSSYSSLGAANPEISRLECQHRVFQPSMMDLMEHAIEDEPESGYRILDVGCGSGYETVLLANRVNSCGGEVIGIDINDSFLYYAKQINSHSSVKYTKCDIACCSEDFFPENYFNLVYFRLTLCWLSDVEKVLRKVCRWLTRTGRIMCIEPIFEGGFSYPYASIDKKFGEATKQLLRNGDAFIGARLPELFELLNMRILFEEPFVLFGGPGSAYSHYIRDSSYYLCDLLLYHNLISLEDVAMYKKRLENLQRAPMSREYSQILVKFVAVKQETPSTPQNLSVPGQHQQVEDELTRSMQPQTQSLYSHSLMDNS